MNRSAETELALDSSLSMQTPEGIEYVLFPAGIIVRACAWGIDFVVRFSVLFCLFIFTSLVIDFFGVWFYYILYFAMDWFYYVVFEMIWNGQTPGKRIMKIRVVCSDGTPVTAGASFLRNLLRFADGFFFLYLIAFLSMAASKGFRRIGDWAGDTIVIYTSGSRLPRRFSASTQNTEAIPWLKDIPVQHPGGKLSYDEKQALLMFARRYPVLGKNRADEIARPWAAQLRKCLPDASSAISNADTVNSVSDSEYLLGIAHSINGML